MTRSYNRDLRVVNPRLICDFFLSFSDNLLQTVALSMKVTILLPILLSVLKGTKQAGYEGERKKKCPCYDYLDNRLVK